MGKMLYLLAKYSFIIYFKIIARWEVEGRKNLPLQGPLIVMANHTSTLDPPVVGCVLKRQVFFMAKEELFKNPIASWAFKMIGVFPVRRGKPDLKAIKNAFKIIKEDKVLGMFPEGTRNKSGEPGQAQAGAVMIALKSKAPILPIGISNINNQKRLKVSIGEVFKLEKYYDKKINRQLRDEVGKLIMNKIKAEME